MNMIKRLAAVAVVSGAVFAAAPAAAQQVAVTGTKPVAKVTILKPLELTKVSDLDFARVLLSNVTGPTTISMAQDGTLTCPTGIVVCSGTPTVGGYNVKGTNKEVVTITAPDVVMQNTTTAGTSITVKLSAPASVTMPNSGNGGVNFPVGGSFVVDADTAGGAYSGEMNVTVSYP